METDRRVPRIKIREKIEFHNSKTFISSFMLNMGTGGVFIQTDTPLPIDAQFAIRMRIPGDPEIIDVLGRVVWIKQGSASFPAGMGVQFINMASEHIKRIQLFIESCQPECTDAQA